MRPNKTEKTMSRLRSALAASQSGQQLCCGSILLSLSYKQVGSVRWYQAAIYFNPTLPKTSNTTHNTIMNTAEDDTTSTYLDRGVESANGFLNKLFSSCAEDPKGSVHRAWGISLIFVVIFFIVSVIESEYSTV
jgi:hypothetical protein